MNEATEDKINYLKDSLILLKLVEGDFVDFYENNNRSAARRIRQKLRTYKQRFDKMYYELTIDSKRNDSVRYPTTSYRRSIHGDKVLFADITVEKFSDPNYDSMLIDLRIIELMNILYQNFDIEFRCGFIGNQDYYSRTTRLSKLHSMGRAVDIVLPGYDIMQAQEAVRKCVLDNKGPNTATTAFPKFLHISVTAFDSSDRIYEAYKPELLPTFGNCWEKLALKGKQLPDF